MMRQNMVIIKEVLHMVAQFPIPDLKVVLLRTQALKVAHKAVLLLLSQVSKDLDNNLFYFLKFFNLAPRLGEGLFCA
jgi:hypothetical protein